MKAAATNNKSVLSLGQSEGMLPLLKKISLLAHTHSPHFMPFTHSLTRDNKNALGLRISFVRSSVLFRLIMKYLGYSHVIVAKSRECVTTNNNYKKNSQIDLHKQTTGSTEKRDAEIQLPPPLAKSKSKWRSSFCPRNVLKWQRFYLY